MSPELERELSTLRRRLVRRRAEAEQRVAFATYGLNGAAQRPKNLGALYVLEDTATGEARAFSDALLELDLALINGGAGTLVPQEA